MSNKFFQYWSIAATAAALVLLGVLIGRGTYNDGSAGVVASPTLDGGIASGSSNWASPSASEPGGEEEARYTVPQQFTVLPSEWRTNTGDELAGYAIRFDPQRREVIVEQCQHRGYFDMDRGEPLQGGANFCDTVLWGKLLELNETSAVARSREGELVDLALALKGSDDRQELELKFDDHDMKLIAGGKNDLFQVMEQKESIAQQKQALINYEEAEYQQRLALQRQQNAAPDQEIPQYTLPASNDGSDSDRNDQRH